MVQIRKGSERGHANHGWLDSFHTFSFAGYYDPQHMNFRSLRVINEDRIAPGMGFGTHGHRDMEIVTYVLSGSLAHKDSMGNAEVLGPNEIQRMSAGTGIRHSEYNPSQDDPVHLFQVWIEPSAPSLTPDYEQVKFDPATKSGRWKLLAAPEGGSEAVRINTDAKIFVTDLKPDEQLEYDLDKRHAWVHVVRGSVEVNGKTLEGGDAAGLSSESQIRLKGKSDTEVLLFDLA